MNQGKKKWNVTPYFYLIPSLLVFGVFLFYPFFKTVYLSLYKTNKMGQAKLFVGLGNYKELLSSPSFLNSLKVTLIFVLIVVVGSMFLGLVAAVLCNKAFPGIRFFSTAYALPMAIASSSAAMIFQIMLHPSVGIVNKLLGLNINWLNDPKTALYCVAILTAWLNSGINFLYFSAGLGNIDETIYERASVDGASGIQQFFSLTLPGLSPIMFYTLVVNIIQAFQSFGQIKILTEGGPNESTNVIVYSIYRDAFFNYRFRKCSGSIRYFVYYYYAHHSGDVPYGEERSYLLMTDTKNMVLEGFRENTMTKEQLLALKTQMNAKALAKRRTRTGIRLAANFVMAFVILLPLLYALSIAFMPSGELFTMELNLLAKESNTQQFSRCSGKCTAASVYFKLFYYGRMHYHWTDYYMFTFCFCIFFFGI